MKTLGVILLLTVSLGLEVASPSRAQSIHLGDERDAVHRSMGPLYGIYSGKLGTLYGPDSEAFVSGFDRIQDVWEVKTARNMFRVRVAYGLDTQESRLHPTMRVESVTFDPDKGQSGMDMLNEIQAVRDLCSHVCGVAAARTAGPWFLSALVCARPEDISESTAANASDGWTGRHELGTYTICAEVDYGEHPEFARTALKNIVYKHLDVRSIRLHGETLTARGKVDELYLLGAWKPQ